MKVQYLNPCVLFKAAFVILSFTVIKLSVMWKGHRGAEVVGAVAEQEVLATCCFVRSRGIN